jgi:hypothetical protein
MEGKLHRDSRGQPFDPDDIAASERLRRVRAAARARRPGTGQVFVYAGRRVGGVSLSDVDLRTVTAAAGGLMVQEQEAGTALAMRRAGMDVPVILDPARYLYPTTAERPQQPSLWNPDPLGAVAEGQAQHRVAAYLSPAGFVTAGDHSLLQAVLDEGLRFAEMANRQSHRARALIAFPISTGWLRHPDCRKQLIDTVSNAGVGIALFPGGSGDPLGGRQAVAGLVELLDSARGDVAVMRTDLAGIGAMAFGAVATSIGLSTALRHTVETGRRSFAQQDRSPRVLVEGLLSWPRGSQLAQITRDEGLLDCGCPICHGRSLRRFIRDDAESVREAATHSVLAWRAIVDRILSEPSSRRRVVWLEGCAEAIDNHAGLRARNRIALQVPPYLKSWVALAA